MSKAFYQARKLHSVPLRVSSLNINQRKTPFKVAPCWRDPKAMFPICQILARDFLPWTYLPHLKYKTWRLKCWHSHWELSVQARVVVKLHVVLQRTGKKNACVARARVIDDVTCYKQVASFTSSCARCTGKPPTSANRHMKISCKYKGTYRYK